MSVVLNPPHTLGFRRPLTQTVKRTLSATNTNAQPVAFKVKTTAPKLYCVRPNSGRIEPGETVEVQVMLQAMKEEPPLSAKCKDKFLIQSTFITPEKEQMNLQEIWNTTSDASEETKVHQQKVKVTYLAAEGTIDEEDELQANQSSMVANVADSRYDTVRGFPTPETNGHAAQPIPEFEQAPRSQTPHEDAHEEQPVEDHPAPAPAPARVPTPTPPALFPAPAVPAVSIVPVTGPAQPTHVVPEEEHAELLAKYNEAQAELQRMRALLQAMPDPSLGAPPSTVTSPNELRRRNRVPSDASSTMAGSFAGGATEATSTFSDETVLLKAPEGVPLQVVAIIALGVFVTTYLFF